MSSVNIGHSSDYDGGLSNILILRFKGLGHLNVGRKPFRQGELESISCSLIWSFRLCIDVL